MNPCARYWKIGGCIFDIMKVSFISAYNRADCSFKLIIDGCEETIRTSKEIYLAFVDNFPVFNLDR
jgi:hypothetical protein